MQYVFNIKKSRVLKNKILYYLKAGALLHLCSLLSGLIALNIFVSMPFSSMGAITKVLLFFFSLFTISAQLDARSRYQDYKRMKDLLHRFGFKKSLIIPFSYSHCQRDAILVAAQQFELDGEIRKTFQQMGVKPYHLLPYPFTRNPLIIFSRSFLKSTFFKPSYQSKYFDW